jgi:hypothetical protein
MPSSFNPFRWNRLPLDSAGLSAARVMLPHMEHLGAGDSLGLFFRGAAWGRPAACGSLGLFFRQAVNRAE